MWPWSTIRRLEAEVANLKSEKAIYTSQRLMEHTMPPEAKDVLADLRDRIDGLQKANQLLLKKLRERGE